MTQITDDQKYGIIEAVSHLVHRDYSAIGEDFVKLDFIPRGIDITPIVPALTRVFEAALAGGGAKSINFQDLAADLGDEFSLTSLLFHFTDKNLVCSTNYLRVSVSHPSILCPYHPSHRSFGGHCISG